MSSELLPLIRVEKKTDAKKTAERIRARSDGISAAIKGAEKIVRTVRAKGDAALVATPRSLTGSRCARAISPSRGRRLPRRPGG